MQQHEHKQLIRSLQRLQSTKHDNHATLRAKAAITLRSCETCLLCNLFDLRDAKSVQIRMTRTPGDSDGASWSWRFCAAARQLICVSAAAMLLCKHWAQMDEAWPSFYLQFSCKQLHSLTNYLQ